MIENQLFSELNLKGINIPIKKDIDCCKVCECCLGWFFTLGSWTFIILVIITQKLPFIIYAFIFYFIYIILELCSPRLKSLCNISNKAINEIIENFIKGKPNFYLKCECYHYEPTSSGNKYSSSYEVVSHSETINYNYISYRDISGVLFLNTDKSNIKGKYYIELEIIRKIYLPDEISISHYDSLKNNIIEKNRHRDTYYRVLNCLDIERLPNSYLIKLRKDEEPCCVSGGFWYVIFSIFTFAELYKIYVNHLILYQTFTIKKVVSISYDVNTDPRFNGFNPSFFIKHTKQHFHYNQLNNNSLNMLINNGNNNIFNVFHNENIKNPQNNINQKQEIKNESLSTNPEKGNN